MGRLFLHQKKAPANAARPTALAPIPIPAWAPGLRLLLASGVCVGVVLVVVLAAAAVLVELMLCTNVL